MYLPSDIVLGIRYNDTLGTGPGRISNPEESVRTGSIVGEALDEYRALVHCVSGSFYPVSKFQEWSDFSAVIRLWMFRAGPWKRNLSRISDNITQGILKLLTKRINSLK